MRIAVGLSLAINILIAGASKAEVCLTPMDSFGCYESKVKQKLYPLGFLVERIIDDFILDSSPEGHPRVTIDHLAFLVSAQFVSRNIAVDTKAGLDALRKEIAADAAKIICDGQEKYDGSSIRAFVRSGGTVAYSLRLLSPSSDESSQIDTTLSATITSCEAP